MSMLVLPVAAHRTARRGALAMLQNRSQWRHLQQSNAWHCGGRSGDRGQPAKMAKARGRKLTVVESGRLAVCWELVSLESALSMVAERFRNLAAARFSAQRL